MNIYKIKKNKVILSHFRSLNGAKHSDAGTPPVVLEQTSILIRIKRPYLSRIHMVL